MADGSRWLGDPLDDLDKGAPGHGGQIPLHETGQRGWNILAEDLPLPVAVLKDSEMRGNSAWMREYLALSGFKIAPHGKTSMAPALFDLQVEDGAWGITLSTPHQIRVARRCGFKRIFLANQLVGRAAIAYAFRELASHPDFELYCLSDSVEHAAQLEAVGVALGAGRRLNVLVELGFEGGRTGCRTNEQALAVAQAISGCRHLALCGLEGFEALIPGTSWEERLQNIRGFLDRVVAVAESCSALGLFDTEEVILSAGGSAFFDLVVDRFKAAKLARPATMVIRSGCYLTLDSVMFKNAFARMQDRLPGLGERLGELKPALEVWAYVQSRPEDQLVIAALGKRDISYDDMPVPAVWFRPGPGPRTPSAVPEGHRAFKLDDQHCYLRVPADTPLRVGDMIGFGMSHPCLTFDKWRVLHTVNGRYDVTGSVRTFF